MRQPSAAAPSERGRKGREVCQLTASCPTPLLAPCCKTGKRPATELHPDSRARAQEGHN